MSTCPFNGSVNSTGLVAALGTVVGAACVQVEVAPSHSQVSFSSVTPTNPPNSTSRRVLRSYPIAAAERTPGATGVVTCDHVVPSKVQVSLSCPAELKPPKITIFLLTGSKALAKPARGGRLTVGVNLVQ